MRSTLERYPTTRLGKLMRAPTLAKVARGHALTGRQILELCDEFMPGDPPEYFFDRCRTVPKTIALCGTYSQQSPGEKH